MAARATRSKPPRRPLRLACLARCLASEAICCTQRLARSLPRGYPAEGNFCARRWQYKQVFVLQFPVGEFNMVVFDPAAAHCRIFEIKHSTEAVPAQYRHLVDPKKCAETEHRFGPIMEKTVLYRGEPKIVDGIRYENIETYLRGLKRAR